MEPVTMVSEPSPTTVSESPTVVRGNSTTDESGGLTGTPTVPGSYGFTVQVADASQPADQATAALNIRVV